MAPGQATNSPVEPLRSTSLLSSCSSQMFARIWRGRDDFSMVVGSSIRRRRGGGFAPRIVDVFLRRNAEAREDSGIEPGARYESHAVVNLGASGALMLD
jgi:hypothetical protein